MTSVNGDSDSINQSENDNKSDDRMPQFPSDESQEGKTEESGTDGLSELNDDTEDTGKHYGHLKEIKHLKRRIKNVQEISIQLSRDAIASDVDKYQKNVLNATQGCVNEWRAIALYYDGSTSDDGEDKDSISSELRTQTGLIVFQLIQLSVQSGPLTGSNPGYFKRCGAECAKVVLEFLEEVVPTTDGLGIDCMGFSSNQMNAMKKWMSNAKKAIENDKPPSRTALKKMKQLQAKVEKQNLQKRNKIKRKEKRGQFREKDDN